LVTHFFADEDGEFLKAEHEIMRSSLELMFGVPGQSLDGLVKGAIVAFLDILLANYPVQFLLEDADQVSEQLRSRLVC
jgi:hypothetical protein